MHIKDYDHFCLFCRSIFAKFNFPNDLFWSEGAGSSSPGPGCKAVILTPLKLVAHQESTKNCRTLGVNFNLVQTARSAQAISLERERLLLRTNIIETKFQQNTSAG